MNFTCEINSPVGALTLASDGTNITGLWLKGQKYYAATLGEYSEQADLPVFAETQKWLSSYFSGNKPSFTPPLAPQGNPFRQAVWDILGEIPYGQVITYGHIARQMARQMGKMHMSAQAVGGAVGHNPISIIIPCHRVVGADGSLTGYAGGVDKKILLLQLEGVDMERLYIPRKGTAL